MKEKIMFSKLENYMIYNFMAGSQTIITRVVKYLMRELGNKQIISWSIKNSFCTEFPHLSKR
jgi:hypothetical protein